MIKKIFATLICAACVLGLQAKHTKNCEYMEVVKFGRGIEATQIVNTDLSLNFEFRLTTEDDLNDSIEVWVQSKDFPYAIFLDQDYDDEQLRDKLGEGKYLRLSKTNFDYTDTFEVQDGIENPVIVDGIGNKALLKTISIPANEDVDLVFVYYDIQSRDGSTRDYEIVGENILRVTLNLPLWDPKADEKYTELAHRYAALKNEIDTVTFCPKTYHPNPDHPVSIEEQKRPLRAKIDKLAADVLAERNSDGSLMSQDRKYQEYTSLHNRVTALAAALDDPEKIEWCGSCTQGDCGCMYQGKSEAAIYNEINKLYQNLFGGLIKKETAVQRAKTLYTHYTQHDKSAKNPAYKAKIEKCYNAILNYRPR